MPKGGAAISELAPQTFYQGGHPTARLSDDDHAGFEVRATVDLLAAAVTEGVVSVIGGWPNAVAVAQNVSLAPGNNSVVVMLPASQTRGVRLWHPHGHGDQPRYSLTATFTASALRSAAGGAAVPPATTERLMGFRHAVLITTNDTDAAVVANSPAQNGTGQFTMFFRVNGAPVYARGANKVSKNGPFEPFIYKNEHFTKTGSGQT